jgi:serine/threonine protein kinase
MTWRVARNLTRFQAAGIHYLHCIGIIHRDIKPNNFLIDWSLNARVSDLGLAWISPEAKPLRSSENYAHLNVGTSVYKAPEVHALADKPNRNNRKFSDPCEHNLKYAAYSLKVDWWGYGMTVYELTRLIYESPKWDPTKQDLSDLMKAWKQAQMVKMPWAFREEPNAQEGATQGEESDDPWSKALTERNVPQEFHGLLEKVGEIKVYPSDKWLTRCTGSRD